MADLFEQLNDENFFTSFVKSHYQTAPREIASVMTCDHVIADDRITYAYGEYRQNISKFAVLLQSSNPDHYKRAGALLHSLASSDIVTDIVLGESVDNLEAGFTRVLVGDAQHVLPFVRFYETYYNQALAFDFAYRCCAAYEDEPRPYTLDYLHTVCRYLTVEPNLSLDACFILFKSLMT